MSKLELIDVEGEPGVVLPEQILSRLGATLGDELVLVEVPPGYLLTPVAPASEAGAEAPV
jgi:hypothetical protein